MVPRNGCNFVLGRREVLATSVNPADAKTRAGNLALFLRHSFPLVRGQDFAGSAVTFGLPKFTVPGYLL